MIPVYQTIYGDDPRPGNCAQAAVASLLELPLDAVPHFFEDCTEENYLSGWGRFDAFFEERGVYVNKREASPRSAPSWIHLAGGPSPRGIEHMVVADGFDIIHDPHPDGGGLEFVRTRFELVVVNAAAIREPLAP